MFKIKYWKYLLIAIITPIILFFITNNPSSAQAMNPTILDQEITKISQLWEKASNEDKAKLGLVDMLLYNAKDRLSQEKYLAQQLYENAISLADNPKKIGNPGYYRFTVFNDKKEQIDFYAIGTTAIAYLLIAKNNIISLDSIHSPRQHHSFIKPTLQPRPLWSVSFTDANREKFVETFINSTQAKLAIEPDIITNTEYTALNLQWENITVPQSEDKAKIAAQLRLYPNDKKSDWYINVEPISNQKNAQKVLYEVEFPIINNLGKQTGNNNKDYLVLPVHSGKILINPAETLSEPSKLLYPGQARWQSMAYYQGNHGINYMTTDADGYLKTAIAQKSADNQTIKLSWKHHPAGQGFPKSKLIMFGANPIVNYSCRIESFEGNWYNSAQVYREWMLAQNFLGTGKPQKLINNSNSADWAKKLIVSYRTFSSVGDANSPDVFGDKNNQVRQVYDFHQQYLPKHSGQISMYSWRAIDKEISAFYDRPELQSQGKNYIGPNFGVAIAKLRANNLHGNPYIEAPLWDINGTTYKAENGSKIAMLYYDRRIIRVKFGKGDKETVFTWVNVGEEQWIKKQEGVASTLLQQGKTETERVDGVYFDLGLVTNHLNHRNPQTVGGNNNTLGWKNLVERINNKTRKGNGQYNSPTYTLFTEGMADCYLNLNNFYLHFQADIPYDVALWGDYSKTYGSKSGWIASDSTEDNWQQGVALARDLAWGQPIGRIDMATIQAGDAVTKYLINLANYRQANLEYLSTGRMVKPVTINQIDWNGIPNVPPNKLPDVMIPNGVFTHPNEKTPSTLFLFVNGTAQKSAKLNFTIDKAQYNIPSNYQLYRRTVNADSGNVTDAVVGKFSQDKLSQTIEIKPLEIVTYVAKP